MIIMNDRYGCPVCGQPFLSDLLQGVRLPEDLAVTPHDCRIAASGGREWR